jgi:hypothetical protein
MEFVVAEYDGTGLIAPDAVGAMFRAAWWPYVETFSGDPPIANMFANYIEKTCNEEFSSVEAFRGVHVGTNKKFLVCMRGNKVVGHVAIKLNRQTFS